jgi:sugar (pentulose or hexulose) kinase
VERRYSPEILRLYGLQQHTHLLPEITCGRSPTGELLKQTAHAMGVRAGIPVVMAPYDIVATATGSGCVGPGEGCLILGTTICAEVIATDPCRDRTPCGTTIALDAQNLYLRAMPTLTGCEAVDWTLATLKAGGVEDLSRMAALAPVGSHGVVCLPYFSPAGERSPFLAPSAKASLLGLSLTHTREDIARATFEGLSFVIRECFSAASASPLGRVTACGGGSRSNFWCQTIADVCGCEVFRPSVREIGARGALIHALCATGNASSVRDAVQQCEVDGQLFQADSARAGAYKELFQRFQMLREMLAPTWEISHGQGRQ